MCQRRRWYPSILCKRPAVVPLRWRLNPKMSGVCIFLSDVCCSVLWFPSIIFLGYIADSKLPSAIAWLSLVIDRCCGLGSFSQLAPCHWHRVSAYYISWIWRNVLTLWHSYLVFKHAWKKTSEEYGMAPRHYMIRGSHVPSASEVEDSGNRVV